MPIVDPHVAYSFAALAGLLVGLIVAELYYHKAKKHANHVVPAIIVKNSAHIYRQKLWYYGLFCTFLFSEYVLKVHIPEACYYLNVFAIAGGDIQKLATKFFRLK